MNYRYIGPWFLAFLPLVVALGAVAVVFLAGDSDITRISVVVTAVGILAQVMWSHGTPIEIALGESNYEKLAAKVYESKESPGSEIFSVLEHFRAPEVYLKAFRNSKARRITIIGSARPGTKSFLGAIIRADLASRLANTELNIYHVDYHQINVKFIISELGGKPQHIVVAGAPGQKSRNGIDLCKLNDRMFRVFKTEFERLLEYGRGCPMEDHLRQTIISEYRDWENKQAGILDFITKKLVEDHIAQEFQRDFGHDALETVIGYVKKVIGPDYTPEAGSSQGAGRSSPTADFEASDVERLVRYLHGRPAGQRAGKPLSVILDLTYFCNLECEGCGVPFEFRKEPDEIKSWKLSMEEIRAVIKGVARFAAENNLDGGVRFCIGGGEPTLHPDFEATIAMAGESFGRDNVTFDTNGTTLTIDRLRRIAPNVGNIGIGLDGDAKTHDELRNPDRRAGIGSVYDAVMRLLHEIKNEDNIRDKVEIVFTPTRRNSDRFWHVAKTAAEIRIKRISCHRFMLTGRARKRHDLEPTAEQYFNLFLDVARAQEELGLDAHFHHSFEQLLCNDLGIETPGSQVVAPCKVCRAAICISPNLRMHFCPWFAGYPMNELGIKLEDYRVQDPDNGDFYDIATALEHFKDHGYNRAVCPVAAANLRCDKCQRPGDPRVAIVECLRAEDELEKKVVALFRRARESLGSEEKKA